MTNAIIIGASSESTYSITQAKKLGLHVIAFDGDKHAKGLSAANEHYVVDINNPQKLYDIIDSKKINSSNMIVVPVPIGRILTTTGSFCDHYGLIGVSKKTAEVCTDKWLFHQKLSEVNLRSIKCSLIKKGEKLEIPNNFPIIAKPRYGSGSRNVTLINTKTEWNSFVAESPFDEDYIIEDYVDGIEYGVDGLVIDDAFQLILVRKKINTPAPYRQCIGYISEKSNTILSHKVCSLMKSLTKHIGPKNGMLHADIILHKNDLFIIEMSARPSGHYLHNVFTPLVTKVDLISEYLKYAMHKDFNIKPLFDDYVYGIYYYNIDSEIKRIPDKDYLCAKYPLIDYNCNLRIGEQHKTTDGPSLMKYGYYILRGKSESELNIASNNIIKEFI